MTVLDEAQNIGGIVTAARRRESWQRQMANTTDDEKREALREAIADLETRFPELEEVGPGQADQFARSRGHGKRSRSPVHEGRRRAAAGGGGAGGSGGGRSGGGREPRDRGRGVGLGGDSKAAKKGGRSVPGVDPGARRSSSGRSRRQPTPSVDKAIRQTRIPATAESATSATMLGLGATVGLALLYLVVSSAEKPGSGAAAVPTVIQSVTGWLGRFLSLGDIFPSSPRPAAGNAPAGAPLPSASEQRQAQQEGKKLLPRLPELQPPKHRTRAHRIHFDPNNVQGAGR